MSASPRLAAKGREHVLQTNTVPARRVGPGFAGISNSPELGHGLGTLAAGPWLLWGFVLGEGGGAAEGEEAGWVSVTQRKVAPF